MIVKHPRQLGLPIFVHNYRNELAGRIGVRVLIRPVVAFVNYFIQQKSGGYKAFAR